ncbi:DUF2721 domain-containing protein [Elusimicrobiota bacterium]
MPIIQLSISPVILISGIGLLLLTLTNRLGRIIDRSRKLSGMYKQDEESRGVITRQLDIISKRGKCIRISLLLSVTSILIVSILIILIFIASLMSLSIGLVIIALFIISIILLSVSLVCLLIDINLSLKALQLEVQDAIQ